ncbi:MAG TPA: hypothetical protein VGO82_10635, partial [Enterovirga sp.]|nr:hypothetical protein [Enterovirga sp.]
CECMPWKVAQVDPNNIPASVERRSGSWWSTLPGLITAITGLIGAIAGLLTAAPPLIEKLTPFFQTQQPRIPAPAPAQMEVTGNPPSRSVPSNCHDETVTDHSKIPARI